MKLKKNNPILRCKINLTQLQNVLFSESETSPSRALELSFGQPQSNEYKVTRSIVLAEIILARAGRAFYTGLFFQKDLKTKVMVDWHSCTTPLTLFQGPYPATLAIEIPYYKRIFIDEKFAPSPTRLLIMFCVQISGAIMHRNEPPNFVPGQYYDDLIFSRG